MWDLLSVMQDTNLMPSESQHVRLVLYENGVDYLSRHHSNRWVLAPQPPSSGRVYELTTSDLHDRIESGSLDWCHPEKAVFTGVTRVSGGDGSDEGELEDHFDSSDSDPEDDEGDVSDDGSLEEIEAPSRNSGTRSIYVSQSSPQSRFMKIAKFALQAFASIGSSDCSLEPFVLALSFASKGKAAVLSPADGRFAVFSSRTKPTLSLAPPMMSTPAR